MVVIYIHTDAVFFKGIGNEPTDGTKKEIFVKINKKSICLSKFEVGRKVTVIS